MNEQDIKKFRYYNSILGTKLSELELKEKYEFFRKNIFYNKEAEKEILEYSGGNFFIFSYDLDKYCEDVLYENMKTLLDARIIQIKKNIDNLIIFKLDETFKEKTNKTKFDLILPFNNLYIDIKLKLDEGNSLYQINGFIITKLAESCYEIFYVICDEVLDKQYPIFITFREANNLVFNINQNSKNRGADIKEKVANEIKEKIRTILINLMDKINTKQYSEYYKIENNKYIKKEIVYASKKSYKMHFWKDSGRYVNIYSMDNNELTTNGYGIDELVFRGNELRNNVPYKIIDEQHKEKEKKNKVLDLRRKKILRQEEKIYKILREIYPNKIIRRHDRKTLKGVELDFNLPELRLGIEYDGEQHFDKELYQKLYGEGFDEQVKRDRKKDRLCIKKKIKLIRIKYDYKINKTSIKKLLK